MSTFFTLIAGNPDQYSLAWYLFWKERNETAMLLLSTQKTENNIQADYQQKKISEDGWM